MRSSLSQSEDSGRYGGIMLFVDRINQFWVKGCFPDDWSQPWCQRGDICPTVLKHKTYTAPLSFHSWVEMDQNKLNGNLATISAE